MSDVFDHDLIGYLLDVLEPDERKRIETALAGDPALRERLDALRRGLTSLEDESSIEPPEGLADRTCAFVAAHAKDPIEDEALVTPRRQARKLTREPLVGVLSRHLAPGDDSVRAKIASIRQAGNCAANAPISFSCPAAKPAPTVFGTPPAGQDWIGAQTTVEPMRWSPGPVSAASRTTSCALSTAAGRSIWPICASRVSLTSRLASWPRE